VLEAFAAGLPVVSTKAGDLATLVRNGETGSIVPHDNPEAMAEAVANLLENPDHAQLMARRARQEVEIFSWPRVRADWAAAYGDHRASLERA
jgi:glycosyltransferase involved in cell wall biosynthesis